MRIREGVICTEVCGEHMLVATNKAKPYCRRRAVLLNETGYQLLQLFGKGDTPDEIIGKFINRYTDTGKQAGEDIRLFLEALEKEGFVEYDT